ncbi:MAG TPA: DUF3618 domain-containing protein [Galbitalea sp.]|jgi:hypothetical protein|nr:DUF3618 domain-containing protein [Galbitalea sp.]
MSKDDDIQSQVARTRKSLETTLDEIEDKFNVPKRVSDLAGKAKASYESNPTPWIVGATGVAIAVIGIVAWAIFSGDDD